MEFNKELIDSIIEFRLKIYDERIKQDKELLNKLDSQYMELIKLVIELKQIVITQTEALSIAKAEIKALEKASSDKTSKILWTIATAIITGVIGFVISSFLNK